MKISAVIIAGNEEAKIAGAIRSVDWADEVLVIDSESTDSTREIASRLGARVIVRPWPGFAAQKQFATDSAKYDWIFSLDADERVSEELKNEIARIRTLPGEHLADGYRIPRLAVYMGRPVRHGGWYPDWQMRLFDRRMGRWAEVVIHESFKLVSGAKEGRLSSDIVHLTVESLAEHDRMIRERYAPLGARAMFDRGRRTSPLRAWVAGPAAFVSTFLLRAGFLDGAAGFQIARFAGRHARLKHQLLLAIQAGEVK